LTRRIVIRGDAASTSSKFGVHTMFLQGANIHLSGVEFFRAGQMGQLGRYPVHFHVGKMFADGQGTIFDTTVHHSFQRCYTIHDTYSRHFFLFTYINGE
jgi:hypothetical protein